MINYKIIAILCIVIINCIAYALMCFDKYKAKTKGQRIVEHTLFLTAIFFGALGIYMGMKAPIYHKASKAKFKYGIPLLVIFNFAVIWFVYSLYNSR